MIINPYAFAAASGGSDPYFADVAILMHFDGTPGDNTFIDVVGNVCTPHNTMLIDATTIAYAQSGLFSGTSWISMPHNASFDIASGQDFTFECVIEPTNVAAGYQIFLCRQNDGSGGMAFQLCLNSSGQLQGVYRDTPGTIYAFNSAAALVSNTTYNVGLRRISGVSELYLNNTLVATDSRYTGALQDATHGFIIGSADGGSPGSSSWFYGRMDEFRYTVGVARDLTVAQTAPWPNS